MHRKSYLVETLAHDAPRSFPQNERIPVLVGLGKSRHLLGACKGQNDWKNIRGALLLEPLEDIRLLCCSYRSSSSSSNTIFNSSSRNSILRAHGIRGHDSADTFCAATKGCKQAVSLWRRRRFAVTVDVADAIALTKALQQAGSGSSVTISENSAMSGG